MAHALGVIQTCVAPSSSLDPTRGLDSVALVGGDASDCRLPRTTEGLGLLRQIVDLMPAREIVLLQGGEDCAMEALKDR
jgi:hypothetical protein